MIEKGWLSLKERERRMVGIGGAVVIISLIYAFIWSPLSSAIVELQAHLQSQQSLIALMNQANREIQRWRPLGLEKKLSSDQSLLVTVEQTLAEKNLSAYLKQIKQPQTNAVELTFHNVPFDDWIRWLQQLSQQYPIHVQQLKTQKTNVRGAVNAMIVMRNI